MRHENVFLQRSTLIALCIIIFIMVFLINAITAEKFNGERFEPSVTFQNANIFRTISYEPTLTSTTYPTLIVSL